MRRQTPYLVAGLGLVLGLTVLLFEPLPGRLNSVAGGSLLAVAVGAVFYLIVAHGGPGERGPDF